MNKGFKTIMVFLVCAAFLMTAGTVMAGGHTKAGDAKQCMESKFFMKAKMMYLNQDELDLSDKQVDKIKDLKFEVKRNLIKQNAEIDTVKVDIMKELYQDKINTKQIDKLIDKKYDLKKQKAKYLVKSYAQLKGILKKDQYEKLKEIWVDKKKKLYCPLTGHIKK